MLCSVSYQFGYCKNNSSGSRLCGCHAKAARPPLSGPAAPSPPSSSPTTTAPTAAAAAAAALPLLPAAPSFLLAAPAPRTFDIQIVLVWVRIPLLILPATRPALQNQNAHHTIKLSVLPPRHVSFRNRRRRGSDKTWQIMSQPTSWILRLRVLRACRPSSCRAAAAAASSACAEAARRWRAESPPAVSRPAKNRPSLFSFPMFVLSLSW